MSDTGAEAVKLDPRVFGESTFRLFQQDFLETCFTHVSDADDQEFFR